MSGSRYANIDGLRAIAAFGVIVEHAAGDILRASPPGAGAFRGMLAAGENGISAGRFGVTLFFLISGFVVPFSLRGPRPLTHFVVSRFFRLYPAMWLALLAIAVGLSIEGRPPAAATMLADMSMLPALFRKPWLLETYWTLSIELMFYASIMVLFATRCVRRPVVVAGCAFALLLATLVPVVLRTHGLAPLPVQYVGFHLSLLFLGLLVRLAMVEKIPGAWPAAGAVMAAEAVTLVAVADFSLARGDFFIIVGLPQVLATYMLAIAVFIVSIRSNLPRSAVLSWLGAISYSLYLFHGIVSVPVYRLFPLTGQVGDLATISLCVVLTVIVSALVYRAIEQPMIRLGRDLVARRRWAAL